MPGTLEDKIAKIKSHLEAASPREVRGRLIVEFSPEEELEFFVPLLNHLDVADPQAIPIYEQLSGAFIWNDELLHKHDEINFRHPLLPKRSVSSQINGFMRSVFHYRTAMICSEIEGKRVLNEYHESCWNSVQQIAPDWIGLLPERRAPNAELAKLRDKESKKFIRSLEALERLERMNERKQQATTDDQPPSTG